EGIIITGEDIAQVSPVKKIKDSSDSEDGQSASEDIGTIGTKGASDAQVVKGKEPIVTDTTAATPKRKSAGKDKVEVVVKEKKKRVATSVSDKENVTKKQRTQKKRA
ncbi:hypothetical protein A2U01_0068062, partial [Trifolium medium]|nr:hypothetical protein [Trifolium medium]